MELKPKLELHRETERKRKREEGARELKELDKTATADGGGES